MSKTEEKAPLLDRGEMLYLGIMIGLVWPFSLGVVWLAGYAIHLEWPRYAPHVSFSVAWSSFWTAVCMTFGGIVGLRIRRRKVEGATNK